jgi:hypothetical protein
MTKHFLAACGIVMMLAAPAAAQIMTGPYGGPNYIPDNTPQYGIYAPRTYYQEPPQNFQTPPLPRVPDVSRGYVPAPSWGGPQYLPCTMPGCR